MTNALSFFNKMCCVLRFLFALIWWKFCSVDLHWWFRASKSKSNVMDDMDLNKKKTENNRIHLEYKYVRISNFKWGVHMFTLEMNLKGHWSDNECLPQWPWILISNYSRFTMLPTLLKMVDSTIGLHPWAMDMKIKVKVPPLGLIDLIQTSIKPSKHRSLSKLNWRSNHL